MQKSVEPNFESKKVAIFHWGLMSIHCFYLAEQLALNNIQVDIYLYSPDFILKDSFQYKLVDKLPKNVKVTELVCTQNERNLIAINSIIGKLYKPIPQLCINAFLPARTRNVFDHNQFDSIFTITQSSLYWLYQTDETALKKVIHYTLEIDKLTDPGIVKRSFHSFLIKIEKKLLHKVNALMVQDEDRAYALLTKDYPLMLKHLHFPVSVPGEKVMSKNNYLHSKLHLPSQKKIILYYGAIYRERKIDELVEAAEKLLSEDYILVLHGAGDFSHLTKNKKKVLPSTEMLPFEELYKLCSSARIAIAFYDQGWPNTQLTAFSSEKIARYLQCGVPFIALKNANYLRLKNEFNCCILIEDFNELEKAIEEIENSYNDFVMAAYAAFEKYYKIENTIKPVLEFIRNQQASIF